MGDGHRDLAATLRQDTRDVAGEVRAEPRDPCRDLRRAFLHDRPRLRKRAGRYRKEQHRRRSHRNDDEGKMWSDPEKIPADHACQSDTDESADAAYHPLTKGCASDNW